MNYLEIGPGHITRLDSHEGKLKAAHEFELDQIRAINAAIASCRPLLVRGEPGIGKSQLARAAARELGCAFISQVVDSRTESRDLQWHFDAVARLADAQVLRSRPATDRDDPLKDEQAGTLLPVADYLHPRALWWAFDWDDAEERAKKGKTGTPERPDGWTKEKGCVVLIDEIDKAESDVPNGLLEALGTHCFQPQGLDFPVTVKGAPPLVIITTNEERVLPDAFVRRCLVLHLKLTGNPEKLRQFLVIRGKTHFNDQTSEAVYKAAAGCLVDDRKEALDNHWYPLPGQAEYLDLLRAVIRQTPLEKFKGPDRKDRMYRAQEKLIGEVKKFVLRKHPDAARKEVVNTEVEN